MSGLQQCLLLGRMVLGRALACGCLQLSASLAFTTLLALVPLLTVMLTIASAFPTLGALTAQLDDFVAAHVLPSQISPTVIRYLQLFSERAGRLTAIGIVLLGLTSLLTLLTVGRAFDRIWQTSARRSLPNRFAVYWAVLSLGPILIGASLSMTSYFMGISVGLADRVPVIGMFALWTVSFALTVMAFTLLYLTMPSVTVKPQDALLGGILAGVLFEIAKRGFAIYIAKFPSHAVVYGTFAAFPLFLVWIYISWLVALLGATLTACLPDWRNSAVRYPDCAGLECWEVLLVLQCLCEAHYRGRSLDAFQLAAMTGLRTVRCEQLLKVLIAEGWVGRLESGRLVISVDPETVSIADVAKRFLFDNSTLSGFGNEPLQRVVESISQGLSVAVPGSLRQLVAGSQERGDGKARFPLTGI